MTIIIEGGREFVEHSGGRHAMGCRPPHAESGLPKFAAAPGARIIPQSDWVDTDLEQWLGPVKDQNGYSACVGHGCTSAIEGALHMSGHDRVQLSAWLTYACVDGGRDEGAVVSDCLKTLKEFGTCLDATVKYGTFVKSKIPQSAWDEAKRFRLFEGYALDSFDAICSAIQLGFFVPFGTLIGYRFEPDASGVIPPWSGRTGGHCMCAVGVKKIVGEWHVKVRNSWSEKWGVSGCCYMPQSYFDGQPWPTDAFAIQSTYLDPQWPGIFLVKT